MTIRAIKLQVRKAIEKDIEKNSITSVAKSIGVPVATFWRIAKGGEITMKYLEKIERYYRRRKCTK